MLRALNTQEPRRPVKQWQTSFHSTIGEVDCLIVTNVTSRGAWGVCPWCVSIVFCTRARPGLNAHTYSASVPLNRRHTHQQKGEETLWDVTRGLLLLWLGSPWCQPSDDSHVDEVNFLLAKCSWLHVPFKTIFWLYTSALTVGRAPLQVGRGWRGENMWY